MEGGEVLRAGLDDAAGFETFKTEVLSRGGTATTSRSQSCSSLRSPHESLPSQTEVTATHRPFLKECLVSIVSKSATKLKEGSEGSGHKNRDERRYSETRIGVVTLWG